MSFEAYEYIYEVSPGKAADTEGGKSSSPIYRSKLSPEGDLETTLEGCSTLYELFKHFATKHRAKNYHGKRIMTAEGEAGPYEWQKYRHLI